MSEGFVIRGASATGERHLSAGTPCQDAYAHGRAEGDWIILAVADGLSSGRRSGEGAALAVGAAVDLGRTLGPAVRGEAQSARRTLIGLMETVASRVDAAVRAVGGPGVSIEAFDTTLTVAVLSASRVGIVAVGDGLAVVRRADGGHHVVLSPRRVDDPLDRTPSLLGDMRRERTRVVLLEDADLGGVLLATDGLAEAGLVDEGGPRERPHPGLFDRILAHTSAGAPADELAHLLVTHEPLRELTDDDRTVLFAVRS